MATQSRFDWLAPFRGRPAQATGDYTSSHRRKGADYHNRFAQLPGRRLAWTFERQFLALSLSRLAPVRSHLDFAGGTGRIAAAVGPYCEQQTILDVSGNMLAIAATHVPRARLLLADFRLNPDVIPAGTMDLVTSFRFFPNAEEQLRRGAMAFIARTLRPEGRLICNNHRNFWSLPYLAGRMLFLRAASGGMTNQQLIGLAQEHGLILLETRSMGIVPQTDRKALFPWKAVAQVERFAWKHWGACHQLGYNVIFVFAKQ
jgi:SAM-dependent methyltransferase